MKRRAFFGKAGMLAWSALVSTQTLARNKPCGNALKVAHITDVHIRPEASQSHGMDRKGQRTSARLLP